MRRIETALASVFLMWASAALGVQGQVLYTRGSAFGGNGTLKLKMLGGGTTTIDSEVGSAQFSPDGNYVAYGRRNGSTYEIAVANRDGSNKRVLAGSFGVCPGLCWRQSSTIHYSHNMEKNGYAIDVNTGNISVFYSSPQQLWSLSVDTSCTHMTFYSRSISRGIWLANVTAGSGSETFVHNGCGNRMSPDGTKFSNNLHTHQDMYIRNWDKSVHKSLSVGSSTMYWNAQKWSNNSNEWIVYPVGPSFQLVEWSNVWVRNFQTGEKVQVTSGGYHDYPQDFWVGTVSNDPIISLGPISLSFSAVQGGSNPSSQTVSVTNSGGGTLGNVSAAESASWLAVTRSGSGNGQTLTNAIDASGLPPGTYTTTVTVSGGGATNSAAYTVALAVSGPPALATVNVTPASVTVSPGGAQSFTAETLDQHGDPIAATVSWNLSGGGSLSSSTGSSTTFTSNGAEGTYTLTASSGSVSGTATITVASLHLKVNCGSNSYDVAGWDRDDGYVSGGADWTNPSAPNAVDTTGVADAAPQGVYDSVRHNAPSFSFASVGNGDYTVRLHFADAYGPDRRSMDVTIEGQVAVNDLDITKEAGGANEALVKTVSATVSDGNGMQISLAEDGGSDAFICGLEIVAGGPPPPQNQAPVVSAGQDRTITLGDSPALSGAATDDGLPDPPGSLTTDWSKVSGPGNVVFVNASALSTGVSFSLDGTYVLRLTADDGEERASDELTVTVQPATAASITVLAPDGGEVWDVGSTRHILWSATGSTDVVIEYSSNGGSTWNLIAPTVDDGCPDWTDYAWTVPNDPSTDVMVRITDYLDAGISDSSDAPFEIRSTGADADADGLPDSWEEEHFGSTGGCDPGDDADADGLTNGEEYDAGSDPNDPDTDGDGLLDGDDADPTQPPLPFGAFVPECGAGGSAAAVLLLLLALRRRRRPVS